ncbi:MAG: DoxX family protein [Chitinophagaceae bacterium]|nr:DoxX family protein [Chitinophagaceae bacterium]
MKIVILLLKLVITIIVGQTLFFKFSGAEESVYIFSTLGIEPWGRLALGTLELVSIILLWIPKAELYALVLVLGMMSGAIASHLFILGIIVMRDGGELFILGIVTWISSAVLLSLKREEVKATVLKFVAKKQAV